MKKAYLLVLVLLIVISAVGCSTGANQQNDSSNNALNDNVSSNVISNDDVEEIILTKDNIGDYLTISNNITDVSVKEIIAREYAGSGQMTIRTSPRQRGDFEGVTLTVVIEPVATNSGWASSERELIIPFDGKYEETFEKNSGISDFVSKNPSFKVVVKSVSGKFVK